MRSFLMTDQNPVRVVKGGGPVMRGSEKVGETEPGSRWIAHSVHWSESERPSLWMLDPDDGRIGAWADLQDVEGGGAGLVIRKERAHRTRK